MSTLETKHKQNEKLESCDTESYDPLRENSQSQTGSEHISPFLKSAKIYRPSSATSTNANDNFDIQSIEMRRLNGMGRIAFFLEEMKAEIQEFDLMNKTLQSQVRIFKDKNQELEAKKQKS